MAQVRCSRCQHLNPEDRETCAQCNAPLPKVAIQVKSPNPQDGPGRQELSFRQHQLVAGRYTVQNIIGRGGMGCIYKVHDNTLNEVVALKTLLPQFARDKIVVERFFNEARIARQLSHENIVRVHDIGTTDGVIYISMEYLRGKSLRAYMENLMPGQRLPLKSVLRVFDELCGALEYAHQFTIHRDIKPENVMITLEGRVKLMDFGISKLMASTQMTQASVVMGTPFYMSPEQLRNSASVDARADIFSVGVMLYEVLTGNVPVGMAKPVSEIRPDLPPDVDPIVRKCIEQEPVNRFQSASELRDAIREVRVMVDPEFDPDAGSKLYRTTTAAGQRDKLVGWGLVVALAVLMAVGLWQAETQRRERLAQTLDAATPRIPSAPDAPGSLDDYGAPIDQLLPRTDGIAANNPRVQAVLDEGERLWTQAQNTDDPDTQAALAWKALQDIAGPALAPEGMVFIPPGSITLTEGAAEQTVDVEGFFIDQNEVTVKEFKDFAEAQIPAWTTAGGLVEQAFETADLNYPITNVTYYDALAYAAAQGTDLPTEAQWARAAYGAPGASDHYPWNTPENDANAGTDDSAPQSNLMGGEDGYDGLAPVQSFPTTDVTGFGVYDMAGNVSEWTRTPYAPLDAYPETLPEPNFGVMMVVRGGSYGATVPLDTRSSVRFDEVNPYLGFRCIKPFPADPTAVKAAATDAIAQTH